MAIYVEDGLDTCVAESRCDHRGVGSLFDQKGHVAVPQIMESHRFPIGISDCRLPLAAAEGAAIWPNQNSGLKAPTNLAC